LPNTFTAITAHLPSADDNSMIASQAMTRQKIGRGQCLFRSQPMPISPLVWVHSFIEPDLFGPQCTVWQYHFDLSDQSALEIRVRIRVRLKDALF